MSDLFRELLGPLGLPGALFFLVLIVLAPLVIKRLHSPNGAGTHALGRLEGVLQGMTRSQDQLTAALREVLGQHQDTQLALVKLSTAIEHFVEYSSRYQEQGREAMDKIDALYQVQVKGEQRIRGKR